MSIRVLVILVAVGLLLTGCASDPYLPAADQQASDCLQRYQQLDQQIVAAGAADPSIVRVQGFPFLRSTRFLASFASPATSPGVSTEYRDWLQALNRQAIVAMKLESAQLPGETTADAELQRCGAILIEDLSSNTAANRRWRKTLESRTQVAPSYQYWQRVLGLYPLSAIPFRRAVVREHRATRQLEQQFAGQIPAAEYLYYGAPQTAAGTASVFPVMRKNSLGMPLLNGAEKRVLLAQFSPLIATPRGADYDQPGTPVAGGFDASRKAMYQWLDYGRFNGEVSIRLNYSVWFSERPRAGSWDLLAGKLDGIIWRVHLSISGRVLAWDAVHNCGCWYRLYPAAGFHAEAQGGLYREPVYVGGTLSARPRKLLYLQSATHHILTIRDAAQQRSSVKLEPQPYNALKRQQPGLFSSSGLIPESLRSERWLFWPMGIPSAGAMRMQGTHAIAFVGTRHFDDPYLLEDIGLTQDIESRDQ